MGKITRLEESTYDSLYFPVYYKEDSRCPIDIYFLALRSQHLF